MRFLGWRRRRITSNTVVRRTGFAYAGNVSMLASKSKAARFIWLCQFHRLRKGYRMSWGSDNVGWVSETPRCRPGHCSCTTDTVKTVLEAITVDTNWLVWSKDGVWTCSLSAHIRARALLSKTTTESAWSTSRLSVSNELYGCTTTSPSWVFGNTL